MRTRLLALAVIAAAACGVPLSIPPPDGGAAAPLPDAGTSMDAGSFPDAGSPPDADSSAITWVHDVQPLLWSRCGTCHATDAGAGAPGFADSYAALSWPAQRCPGETIGICINRALQVQYPETPGCRTLGTPFHREAWQPCLTPSEIARVADWVDGGMPER